jgi:hypothetical protein
MHVCLCYVRESRSARLVVIEENLKKDYVRRTKDVAYI